MNVRDAIQLVERDGWHLVATRGTGETVVAVEKEIREAIRFHMQGLKEDGLPVPEPTSLAEYVDA